MNLFKSSAVFRHGRKGEEMEESRIPPPPSIVAAPSHPLLPSKDSPRREASEEGERLQSFPSLPYYGLLNGLELQIEKTSPQKGLSDPLTGLVHEKLRQVTEEKSPYYYYGSQPLESGYHQDQRTPPACYYREYLKALTSVFAQMQRARDAARQPEREGGKAVYSPHTVHLRVLHHPKWKHLSILLAIEEGRLLFYVSASSRVTQKEWSDRAAVLATPLVWVSGSAFVVEESSMGSTDVNPVNAAWDILLNFPLLVPNEGEGSVGGGSPLLEVCSVSLFSTLPFDGSQHHTARLRRLESTTRCTWRWTEALVHPPFLAHLMAVLVEHTPVRQFHLYCDSDESPPDATTKELLGAESEGGAVTLLKGRHRITRFVKGSSSQSWGGYSRLSCQSWINTETREAVGLWDDEGEELECEFLPYHIQYSRPAEGRGTTPPSETVEVIDPTEWGEGFHIETKVLRVIDTEPEEEGEMV